MFLTSVLQDDIPVHMNSTWMLSARKMVGWPSRNPPFPHPSQKRRCWDDFLWYLLKQQAEVFFHPDGCIKWTCSGLACFMLLHLHLSPGQGEAPAHCLCCLHGQRPLPAPEHQMVTAAGKYLAVQKVSFLSAPSHSNSFC